MAKGIMIIDGQRVPFDGEKNVLAVIRKAGIDIPTFCYYSELSVHGACRMCMVEDVKTGKIDASCSMEPRDGMEIRTNTAKLLKHRRHDPGAAAGGPRLLLHHLRQERQLPPAGAGPAVRRAAHPLPRHPPPAMKRTTPATPSFRDPNKCILCGDCVRVCEEMQGQGILNFAFRGSELQVMPAFDRKLSETKCVELRPVRRRVHHRRHHRQRPDRHGLARHPRPPEACGGADRPRRPGGPGRGIRLCPPASTSWTSWCPP